MTPPDRAPEGTPVGLVSYVMPVLNERESLPGAVAAVLSQQHPGASELILAVGPSVDGTEDLAAALAAADPRIRVVANPDIHIPAGLNRAITASRGAIVIRVDAHAELPSGYTAQMLAALERTGAANVGGVMHAKGTSPVQSAIARAYNSSLGLGGGVYHGGTTEGPADSAYLGVFRRSVLTEVGLYDESLRRGEDYDLNQRIIAAGHEVWFLPSVAVTYWPRTSWSALARQMWATGAWRGEMVRRDRRTAPRYLVAPALVVGLAGSVLAGLAQLAGAPAMPIALLHAAPLSYAAFLLYAGWRIGGDGESARGPADLARSMRALATMHLSWGAGFLRGLVTGAGDTVDRSRVHALDHED